MSDRRRIEDLLVLRATEGLTTADATELARLIERCPDIDLQEFDEAAALVSLAAIDPRARMPAALMETLARRVSLSDEES
jgi:hypothetical protein